MEREQSDAASKFRLYEMNPLAMKPLGMTVWGGGDRDFIIQLRMFDSRCGAMPYGLLLLHTSSY